MDGLTAKVFRTYNASITLQNQLKELTDRMCLSVFYIVTDLSLLLISCDDKVWLFAGSLQRNTTQLVQLACKQS